MQTKTKSVIVILATLLIGMVLGGVITGAVLHNRVFDRMEKMRTKDGFISRMEKFIQPDENQREKVGEILKEHFAGVHRLGEDMRRDFEARNDSLLSQLEQVLRPEQMERLKERMKRMRRFGPRSSPDHHPERPHRGDR